MRFLYFILLLFLVSSANAKVNPKWVNALERGFRVVNDSVIFPDNSKCSLDDFNRGVCGKQWMEIDYCIPEGKPIWNLNKCCDGLAPFLGKGKNGQATCESLKQDLKKGKKEDKGWLENLLNNTSFWIGLLLPFLILGYFAFSVSRKQKKNNRK